MTMIKAALLAATTVLAATPALSQEAGSLRAGTPIELRTIDALDGGNHAGTRFQLEVSSPVMKDGKILIPTGSPAVGEIVTVRNREEPGRSSRIVARLVSVRVAGRTVRLAGGLDDTGTSLVGVIPTGTNARGFIDENVAFAAPRPIPAPVIPKPVRMAVVDPSPTSPAVPKIVEVAAAPQVPRVVPSERRILEGPRLSVQKPTDQLAGARRPMEVPLLETRSEPRSQLASMRTRTTAAKITAVSFVRPKVTVLSHSRTDAEIVSGGVTTHYVY